MFAHARLYLLGLLLCLFCACGGGGGHGGNPGPPTPPPPPPPAATTGSLTVTISGLRFGAARITGPDNFSQNVYESTTLTMLVPGNYVVSGGVVVLGTIPWEGWPASQTVTVTAGATASVGIVYGSITAVELAPVEVATAVNPVYLIAPAGDARQFVVERAGRIRILQNGAFLAQPFLDISARVFTGGEGGLLSIAFDPGYAANGFVYLYYVDTSQNIVIARYTRSANANVLDPLSGLIIISIPHPNFTNHFGGQVAFGPDGFLYLGTGDGGGAGDPAGNAQNPNSLLGKLLRLDVSAASLAQPYAIPPSNPYAGQSGRRGEIWALGLRNPWRFTFDDGVTIIGDVGQDRREEIDAVLSTSGGLNFGWNIAEGSICYNAANCNLGSFTPPVLEYEHGSDNNVNSCSIVGGFVYRGTIIPELRGRYFYSDYCAGFLRSTIAYGGTSFNRDRYWSIPDLGNIVSMGQDGSGELYLIAGSGKIYRITRK